jgi:uncharacterized protein YqeY
VHPAIRWANSVFLGLFLFVVDFPSSVARRFTRFGFEPDLELRTRNIKLNAMSLKEKIVADLTEAMKAKDAGRLSTLRMVKANLMNRQIEKGSELTDEEIQKALQSLVKQRRDSIEQYEKAGRTELAAKEAVEIVHIEIYLPQAASADEIDAAVAAAVAETGASSIKDMGNVMKATMAKLAGKSSDGKMVSEAVKAKLS